MKRIKAPLMLRTETIRPLTQAALHRVRGGAPPESNDGACSDDCPSQRWGVTCDTNCTKTPPPPPPQSDGC